MHAFERALADLQLRVEPAELLEQPSDGDLHGPDLLHVVDGVLITRTGDVRVQFVRKARMTVHAAALARASGLDAEAIYLVDELPPRAEDELRRMGVNFVAIDGRASVSLPSIHVDVRKKVARTSAPRKTSTSSVNLMSPRRAQVIFCLLSWEHLVTASHRELAHAAGVSVGMVPETLTALRRADLLDDRSDGGISIAAGPLIDAWAAAFPTGLAAKLTVAEYEGDLMRAPSREALSPGAVVGGEFAVSAIRNPQRLVVYAEDWSARSAIKWGWRGSSEPNITIRRKFWRHPLRGGLFAPEEVPPLLVYADLLASGDPRLTAAAQDLRRENPQLLAH